MFERLETGPSAERGQRVLAIGEVFPPPDFGPWPRGFSTSREQLWRRRAMAVPTRGQMEWKPPDGSASRTIARLMIVGRPSHLRCWPSLSTPASIRVGSHGSLVLAQPTNRRSGTV